MSSAEELGLPDQHKVRAREIRRKLHTSWSESYEKEHRLEERARKAVEEAVLARLKADLPACELLLALFASAAASSRRNTVCSPFPRSLMGPDGPLFEESVRFSLHAVKFEFSNLCAHWLFFKPSFCYCAMYRF